eukprot:gene5132-8738_t
MNSTDEVLLDLNNYVATITLNRPKKGNSITSTMGNQLLNILQELKHNNKVRIIILTGAGKYFCTGMDLSNKSNEKKLDPKLLFQTLTKYPKPIITKINGPALGGGWGLVFASDIRIVDEGAFFAFSEVKRGLVPAYISSFIVPQIGTFLSKELMMTGRKIDANTAKQMGFVNSVVSNENEMDEKIEFYVNEFMEGGPKAISKIKELVMFVGLDENKEEKNLKFVEETFQWMFKSDESRYGMTSFMKKKKPDWNEFYKSKL